MDISVVVSTYNRSGELARALDSLMAQETGGLTYEIVVVDNNSTDNTRQVIASYAQRDSRVRYVFEKRQGVAYGRNAGITAAQSNFLAFCDDDVIAAPDWIRQLHTALLCFPQADFVGGKVLPIWETNPPSWLGEKLAPLALQDLGGEPKVYTASNRRCLISACLAVRRTAFARGGYFDPATQRVGNGIGSTEDYDWEIKVFDNGGTGVYVPDAICYTTVPADRMQKAYHRRWHLGHGKFNAIARRANFEGGRFRFLGVPSFLYRQFLQSILVYVLGLASGNPVQRFERENDVLFYFGFFRERWKQTLANRKNLSSGSSEASGHHASNGSAK